IDITVVNDVNLKTNTSSDPESFDGGVIYADRGKISITAKNITIDAPNRTAIGAKSDTFYSNVKAGMVYLKADSINIKGSGINEGNPVISTLVGAGSEEEPLTPPAVVKLEGKEVNIEATQGEKIAIQTNGGTVEIGQNEGFEKANIIGDIRSSYNEQGLFYQAYYEYYQEKIAAAETPEEKAALQAELNDMIDYAKNSTELIAANGKADINLGEGGSLKGAFVKADPLPELEDLNIATTKLQMGAGSKWDVTGNSTLDELDANGADVNLGDTPVTVEVEKASGSDLKVNTDNTGSKLKIGENSVEKLTVEAGKNVANTITDANRDEQLKTIANIVDVTNGNKEKTINVAAGDVSGAITVTTDGETGEITTVTEEVNTANAAVSDMASISMMTWRQENNDMNKRLGELRDSKGQHGAWARMARGESKYGAQSVKNQYNYYQIGYDEKLSTDPHWTVGVALTRTEGNSTFKDGSGENNHTGVAVYGSYLGENGSFIDLIAKYSRMDNEYKTTAGVGDADYKTNGYSVSAEYGKRFTKDNGLWIEPQVELTYGTVGSANYMTSKDASVRQDGIDSLVGRVGFALGKNIKAGNVYARASYLYDFDGEANVTYSKSGVTRSFEQDLGGGWWEVGIGSNINLSNATHLYFDVEKTYGGDVATPWQWNVGVRYSF
ncbi:MAG: autotransporter outer membrane beta-barrel domain-containing protein, partial [Phascolarctobacterium sp.]